MKKFLLTLILIVGAFLPLAAQQVVLDNGVIKREIDISNGHVLTKEYVMHSNSVGYVYSGSHEFSFLANDKLYSGSSDWAKLMSHEVTTRDGGKGVSITFQDKEGKLGVELVYMAYPNLPIVRKTIKIINFDQEDLKLEGVNVEDIKVYLNYVESWVMHTYARNKSLGKYIGNWDDPLIVVHNTQHGGMGMAIGNEAVGVLKRTSVFTDGSTMMAGVTHPDQDYPFRRWLKRGESWESPAVFTALYHGTQDPYWVVNTSVQDYVRRHMGIRIEQLKKKPMFVYNTWHPFRTELNEGLIYDLAKAAAECGVEEFVIDDGWQINIDPAVGGRGDWAIDKNKFPNGLKPVFDYIKKLGMKPGLWISLATADTTSQPFKNHPEWFIKDANGNITDLHNAHSSVWRTACMGTDWYDYIKETLLKLWREYGLAYVKLDLAIATSAYVHDVKHSGCCATDHPLHRDRNESFDVIYSRCMQLFDELHRQAPDLFIDCTFETAGKLQLMDYGFAKHAEGNWLSNVENSAPLGSLRIRDLAWGRTPALPATSLVIGNLNMNGENHILNLKSLAGSLPIMLGDPRQLSAQERAEYKAWADWLKALEARHGYMSFRQDVPGFAEPREGEWDAFCRINTESRSGGLVGVFNQGSYENCRVVRIPYLDPSKTYQVKQGCTGKIIATLSGQELKEKGFEVRLEKKYDGELFEIVAI